VSASPLTFRISPLALSRPSISIIRRCMLTISLSLSGQVETARDGVPAGSP
jgi:hypothetical protein